MLHRVCIGARSHSLSCVYPAMSEHDFEDTDEEYECVFKSIYGSLQLRARNWPSYNLCAFILILESDSHLAELAFLY